MKEWINTILVVVLMLALIPLTLWVKAINDELAATQAAQAVSSQKIETFLQQFTAEINYECKVLWYINRSTSSMPPAPAPSVCKLKAP